MQIIETNKALNEIIEKHKAQGLSVGFVPTMGALHKGHISLVKTACENADIVVVSIFVNPTQFNNANDLKNYPRTIDADVELLKETNCAIVYHPSVSEVYPTEDTRIFNFGTLDKVMEGRFRPGHFNGVAQVVSRLFDLVKPNKAFFGQKDFQQLAIIRAMVKKLNFNIEIVACETVREPSGLALSSRNRLLTKEQKEVAPIIHEALIEGKNLINTKNIKEVITFVSEKINKTQLLKVEYIEIVDGNTLQEVENWDTDYIVACTAVFAGEIRLIDNLTYKK